MRLVWLPAIVAGGLAASAAPAHADPSAPDFARAAELYKSAEQEMKDGDYGNAVRDYMAAFDLTSDPVLYFKIGAANEKAGKCEVAVRYFRLYLANAHPADNYVQVTKDRIAACAPPTGERATTSPPPPTPPTPGATTANPDAGSTAVVHSPVATGHSSHGHDAAWIAVAGAVALVTTGVVLAFATSSSENDIKDLYLGNDGQPPPAFNASTSQRYQQLLDEGHHYRDLSWTAFGLAAVAGAASAYLFVRAPAEQEHHARVVPVIAPGGAGVAATLAF